MFDETPLVMVEDDEALKQLAETLASAPVIGVDTESDSMYSYQEKVCLIQFSDAEKDYIVDPLRITDMSPLAEVFSSPDVVKVFHGADYDVVCMHRDFGFRIVNLYDTMVAAQFLARERLGLADLVKTAFGHELDKKYQRHDWSQRPLQPEHLEYARGDTHWLLALRELLTWKLHAASRLGHLEEECALLEQRRWTGRTADPNAWLRMKGIRDLDDTAMRVLKHLYMWRDEIARGDNRPPYKVVPNDVLIQIAKKQPSTMSALEVMFSRKAAMKRRYGKSLVACVHAGLEDDFEVDRNPRKSSSSDDNKSDGPPQRLFGGLLDRAGQAIKTWRNKLVAERADMTSSTVLSNHQIKAVAAARPANLDELRALPDIRNWQVQDHGEAILAILDDVAPELSQAEDGSPVFQERSRRRRRRR